MPEIVYALVPLLKDHDGHHGLEEFEPGSEEDVQHMLNLVRRLGVANS